MCFNFFISCQMTLDSVRVERSDACLPIIRVIADRHSHNKRQINNRRQQTWQWSLQIKDPKTCKASLFPCLGSVKHRQPCVCECIRVCVWMCACMYMCLCVHACACVYVSCMCMFACMCACACVHVYMCMCVYVSLKTEVGKSCKAHLFRFFLVTSCSISFLEIGQEGPSGV